MRKLTLLFIVFHFSFFTFHFSGAQVIHVPADYPTIQQGINAANAGDTVLVADGLYYENIDFLGKKPLVVASYFILNGDTNHIINTIINGSQPVDPDVGSVVTFTSGEDTTSMLCGFTVTGGTGTIVEVAGARAGGGVFIQYSGAKLSSNYIEYNEVFYEGWGVGGGVCASGPVNPLPWVVLINNRINYNQAVSTLEDEGAGGGVENYYNLVMIGNQVSYNEAKGPLKADGSGIRISGTFGAIDLNINNNIITYNKAVSNSNLTQYVIGGLSIAWNCSGIVSNNVISFNELEIPGILESYGAGALVQDVIANDFVFENNLVSDNTYKAIKCLGGGLCLYETGGKFQNNVIQNNKGTHGGGICIINNMDDDLELVNNTITGNAGNVGGGLYGISAKAVVLNTIIWGNTALAGPSIYVQDTLTILEVRYSDVEGSLWPGAGNINVDPEFIGNDWHIHENSPCEDEGIDSINVAFKFYYAPDADFEGDLRPWHESIDMGADECDIFSGLPGQSSIGSHQSSVVCYPNPTQGIVDFRLSMVDFRWVSLKIYDVRGREVAVLLDGKFSGDQVVRWDAGALPPGVYYYRLTTDDRRLTTGTGKMVKY